MPGFRIPGFETGQDSVFVDEIFQKKLSIKLLLFKV